MGNREEGKENQPKAKAKMLETTEMQLKDLSVAELPVRLQSSSSGLSQAEAQRRLDHSSCKAIRVLPIELTVKLTFYSHQLIEGSLRCNGYL